MGFDFEKLLVYKKSIGFANDIYNLTKRFPKEEILGLTNQLRRASVSVALNIAEGSGRTKKEFKHYLIMSKTSIQESVVIIEICYLQKLVNQDEKEMFYSRCIELYKMISGLIRSIV